jgi:ribonuclease D
VHARQTSTHFSGANLRIDRYITSEDALKAYCNDLRTRNIEKIALDLEGDQGTFHYNYSISIFQCFDGQEVVIIDVITMGNNLTLNQFLTDPAVTKIMFSCANDAFITQNVLGCTISPVLDIAVAQKLLNETISLSGYLTIDQKIKNAFQRANWLKRPLSGELLAYAINDVLHLITIEETLRSRLDTQNLLKTYFDGSNSLVTKNYRINQLHHYKVKFPGYPRLSPSRKRTAALIWIVREFIGKHFDCPVGYIL